MKVPIPDDWDGSFECVRVYWPNSTHWRAILRGLLFTPIQGRYWDERTGSIRDAQEIGFEIWERNQNAESCDGVPLDDGDGGSPVGSGGGIIVLGDEDDMGQVVTDVAVVDGKIRVYFGPCCYKDLTGFDVSQVIPDVGDTPWEPTGGENPTYSACGKATAIVNAIFAVIEGAFSAILDVDWPWQILGNIENAVGYNLDNKWIAALWLDVNAAFQLGLGASDVFSLTDRQLTVCNLQYVFGDDAIGVPDSDAYEAVKTAIHTRNFVYDGIIMTAVACLGRGNLDTIAKLGATDTDSDCDCEGGALLDPTEPDENGWYLGADMSSDLVFVEGGSVWDGHRKNAFNPDQDVFGCFMRLSAKPGVGQVKRMQYNQSLGGVPPAADNSQWSDSSDHLENLNTAYPYITQLTDAIRTSLASQRGFAGNNNLGTNGVNGTDPETPPAPVTETLGIALWQEQSVTTEGSFAIVEFRLVHNTNSPSHGA